MEDYMKGERLCCKRACDDDGTFSSELGKVQALLRKRYFPGDDEERDTPGRRNIRERVFECKGFYDRKIERDEIDAVIGSLKKKRLCRGIAS